MNAISTTNLILNSATDYGLALLAILGAVLVIGVGMQIFKIGWRKIKNSSGESPYTKARNYETEKIYTSFDKRVL